MTIGIGFRCADGILICADTKHSYGDAMQRHASKILKTVVPAGKNKSASILAGLAGNVRYGRMGIENAFARVHKLPEDQRSVYAISRCFAEAIKWLHKQHLYPHPPDSDGKKPTVEYLVGIQAYGELGLFITSETAINVCDEYECIGSGSYLAFYLLDAIREGIPGMSMQEVALWATHALMQVKAYDAGCGGWSELQSLGKDGGISRKSYFEIDVNEKYVEKFERETKRLFAAAMSLTISSTAFENASVKFLTEMLKIREQMQERRPEYERMYKDLTRWLFIPSTTKEDADDGSN